MSRERRREMVDCEHPGLSTVRQCAFIVHGTPEGPIAGQSL